MRLFACLLRDASFHLVHIFFMCVLINIDVSFLCVFSLIFHSHATVH